MDPTVPVGGGGGCGIEPPASRNGAAVRRLSNRPQMEVAWRILMLAGSIWSE